MSAKKLSRSARRKARDLAALIPIGCVFLIMPPMVHASVGAGLILGIPVNVIYVFGVWLAVIVLTFWNARRLYASDDGSPESIDAEDYPP